MPLETWFQKRGPKPTRNEVPVQVPEPGTDECGVVASIPADFVGLPCMLSNVPQPCASIPGGLSDTALDKRPSWTECKTCLFAWPSHRPRVNDWGTSLAFCAVVNRRRRTCNDTGTPLCAHSYANVAKIYYILVPGMACFLVPKMGTRTDPKATPMKGSSITYPILAHFWYPISGLICVPVFGTFFCSFEALVLW